MNYNEHQRACIASYERGDNVIVEAVAGSGKTTTIIGMFLAAPERKTVSLTYSRQLAEENRRARQKRVAPALQRNFVLKTFHSYVFGLYQRKDERVTGHNDFLRTILHDNRPFSDGSKGIVDALILDEVQDFCELFYRVIIKILADVARSTGKIPQVVVLGDRFQNIYSFNRGEEQADARYLLEADKLFGPFSSRQPWRRHGLLETYRLNMHHVDFLNTAILGTDHFQSSKPGNRVTYLRGNSWSVARFLETERGRAVVPIHLTQHLDRPETRGIDHLFPWESVMILAHSVDQPGDKRDNPVNAFINHISKAYRVPIYRKYRKANSTGEQMEGKTILSTFCGAKGMERSLVIVFGADAFSKNARLTKCSNAWHVALTRAAEQLVIIEDVNNGQLPFLKLNPESYSVQVVDMEEPSSSGKDRQQQSLSREKTDEGPSTHHTVIHAVTDLLRFQPSYDISSARESIVIQELDDWPPLDDVPTTVSVCRAGMTLTEDVSAINGIVMGFYAEYLTTGNIANAHIGLLIENCKQVLTSENLNRLRTMHQKRQSSRAGWIPNIADMTLLAACYHCTSEHYFYELVQLPAAFDWLEPHENEIIQTVSRLVNLDKFEVSLYVDGFPVAGRCDATSTRDKLMYELKFTSSTTDEHKVQAALYHMIAQKMGLDMMGTVLVNLKTGKRQLVQCTPSLTASLSRFIHNKQEPERVMPDELFHRKHEQIIERQLMNQN